MLPPLDSRQVQARHSNGRRRDSNGAGGSPQNCRAWSKPRRLGRLCHRQPESVFPGSPWASTPGKHVESREHYVFASNSSGIDCNSKIAREGEFILYFLISENDFLISENDFLISENDFLISKNAFLFLYQKMNFWYQKMIFWYKKIFFDIKKSIFWYKKTLNKFPLRLPYIRVLWADALQYTWGCQVIIKFMKIVYIASICSKHLLFNWKKSCFSYFIDVMTTTVPNIDFDTNRRLISNWYRKLSTTTPNVLWLPIGTRRMSCNIHGRHTFF